MLQSENLILRSLNQSDLGRIFQIYTDAKAMKYRANRPLKHVEEARIMIDNSNMAGSKRYGIELRSEKLLIGTFFENQIDRKILKIGYSFDKNYWNRGYATEILHFMIDYYKSNSYHQLIAIVHKKNIVSAHILKKCSFTKINVEDNLITYQLSLFNIS